VDIQRNTAAKDSRRYPRHKCSVEAVVSVDAGLWSRKIPGRVVDYSETGVGVKLEKFETLPIGSRVELRWNIPFGKKSRDVSWLCTVTRSDVKGGGFRFERLLSEEVHSHSLRPVRIMTAGALFVMAGAVLYLKLAIWRSFWYSPILNLYSIFGGTFIISRALISCFYREPGDHGYLPTVSIVIAAMNEQDCIAETIECCYRSRYPMDKIELIVIDDGSKDKTWERIVALQPKFSSMRPIKFPKNLGKRHGMAAGAQASSGEVIVYVDSDTFIEPEALYRIVQPFADKAVGAVSGHILVDVLPDNVISKMEFVRYYISHRILKAAEGVYGAVTCCPGAFSAYRRTAVMEVIDEWLNQRFLGVPATFGDDRSLTNRILKNYHVLYHHGARCATRVPEKWMKYFKQQLRWKRSWCRESFLSSAWMYKEHPIAALSFYGAVLLTLTSPLILIYSLFYLPAMAATSPLHYVGGLLLSYLMFGLLCFFYTGTPYWFYGLTFAFVHITVLSWMTYYAIGTLKKNSWGTR
jgi:hyaluronan synthase